MPYGPGEASLEKVPGWERLEPQEVFLEAATGVEGGT